mmetsp:Transcript_23520/g.26686  ORF Transcript_23520/g.26686 Transcript_23520/m.26686 type:complete len:104 (+) Transcript_23520:348-659(+)
MYNSEQDEALDFRIPVERNNEEVIYTRIKHFKPGFVHSIPLPRHCSGNILLRSDLQKNIDYHCERERTEIADYPGDENLELLMLRDLISSSSRFWGELFDVQI